MDKIEQAHKEAHEKYGTEIHVFLPKECPWQTADEFMDAVATLAFALPGKGWDAFVWANRDASNSIEGD